MFSSLDLMGNEVPYRTRPSYLVQSDSILYLPRTNNQSFESSHQLYQFLDLQVLIHQRAEHSTREIEHRKIFLIIFEKVLK